MDNKQPFDLHGFFRNFLMTDNEALIDRLVECSRLEKRKKVRSFSAPE